MFTLYLLKRSHRGQEDKMKEFPCQHLFQGGMRPIRDSLPVFSTSKRPVSDCVNFYYGKKPRILATGTVPAGKYRGFAARELLHSEETTVSEVGNCSHEDIPRFPVIVTLPGQRNRGFRQGEPFRYEETARYCDRNSSGGAIPWFLCTARVPGHPETRRLLPSC